MPGLSRSSHALPSFLSKIRHQVVKGKGWVQLGLFAVLQLRDEFECRSCHSLKLFTSKYQAVWPFVT